MASNHAICHDNMNDIPQRLFYPARIFILKRLVQEDVEFQKLKTELKMSDGNLWSNMRALEQLGLVVLRKEVDSSGRKVKTMYSITEEGRTIFADFRNRLLGLLGS
jgi:DNA-binding HxlR family transcriptional regulator